MRWRGRRAVEVAASMASYRAAMEADPGYGYSTGYREIGGGDR